MSQTIDHRIVEMRFDNKQFEAGAKETMGTLGRLKEALKFSDSSKALEGLGKATKDIKLDGISAGIEALQNRFSTLGIVGMRVIENLTDGFMNRLSSAVNFVTDSIVSGGIKRAMNIENAHFQLQALLKDEEKVQAVMDNAMESVDGTAYAYDEAAKAASQFAASGIQAGDEMLGALKGITGVAAMTNSSFEDISRIFTTVAGNGRLMGDQLLQLSSRGLNAASTLADYFREVRGEAGMTESRIREMVSDGEISFKIFSEAMTWAFGDSAKRANETFTGALSNMKSALARIGAGFISPLVEQNGELVQLFNALRIKINDVKTALVFDEQTSALSGMAKEADLMADTISGMITDGTFEFDKFTSAILGTSKSEEELSKINEKLSESYNKVKENGSASLDTLIEFNKNGVNASKAIQEYINGVLDGSIKASDSIKESVKEISNGTRLITGDVTQLAKEGKISYDIFTAAIVNSSGLISKESKLTSEAVQNMMSKIKESGTVSYENLVELNQNGMNAAIALRKYIKGVSDGSIRASYAMKQVIEGLVDENGSLSASVTQLAAEGKISYDMLQAAMEETYGDQKTLSKQFTDWFQDHIHAIVEGINNADMTKPMEIFYYWVESTKNLVKGLLSVISPVGKAFADVFLSFNGDDVITFSEAVERLTAKMRLSEDGAKDLHDVFEGLFSVLKLGIDIFFALFGAIVPINKPVLEMGGGFLGLAGSMGRGLTEFTKWIRSCELLKRAFNTVSNGIDLGMESLVNLIKIGKDFVNTLSSMEGSTKLINSITSAFEKLGSKATPYIEDFINESEELFRSLFNIGDINLDDVLNRISQAFADLAWEIDNFSFETLSISFDKLKEKAQGLADLAMSNEGFATFVKNFKEFAEDLREALTMDNLFDRIEKVMDVFGKFFNWVKNTLGPAFEDFNVGSAIAAGGGIGIIYSMIKVAKSFESLSKAFTSIPQFFGTMKGTLVAYQKELKADALLKTAAAIGVLAGALVLLSFADTDRLVSASFALTLIAGTLMLGVSKLLDALNKGKELNTALNIFAKGISKSIKNLTASVKWKAIGGVIKSLGQTILMIAASIVALGLFYRKDPAAFMAAVETVGTIGLFLAGMLVLMGIASKFTNAQGMNSIGASLLMVTGALTLIVLSISKLMNIKMPADYGLKLEILGGIIAGLAGLAVVLGIAARISGGNQLPKMASTIKSLAILMVGTVISIKMLFDMDIPEDYQTKLGILAGIFVGFSVMLIAMGAAAKLSGGNSLKAAGTILSMALFLAVVVGALFVLTLIPGDKMMKGAVALGGILITLGVALYGAGKISDKNAYKTVIAMALTVGVITAALGVLTMIPWQKLAISVSALGSILLAMALNFKALSKIDSSKSLIGVMGMISTTLTIAYALYTLSEQPWQGMLAAAAAMSATMLAFAKAYDMIMDRNWSQNAPKKIEQFALLVLASIPIAMELHILSEQPWEGMLAAASAMSGTLMMFALAYQQILDKDWSQNAPKKMAQFAILVALSVPIAVELGILAHQPWEGLLAGAVAMGTTMLALAGAFKLISGVKLPGVDTMLGLVVLVAATVPLALELKMLSEQPWQGMLAAAASLSLLLISMAVVLNLCVGIGAAAGPAILGAAVLLGFVVALGAVMVGLGALFSEVSSLEGLLDKGIEVLAKIGEGLGRFAGAIIGGIFQEISNSLPVIGENLSKFWDKASGFFYGIADLPGSTFTNMILLAGALIAFTVAELIAGLGALVGAGMLIGVGVELSGFMVAARPFFAALEDINPETVEAAKRVVQMILAFTVAELINGIASLFGFTGSLATFGEELASFGPHIKKFAEDVKDVKPEAVQGAAAAAEIMAEVAKKLPGTGGLVQKIFGEKSLSEFGEELVKFGPNIKEFGEQVKNVKPEAVEGAAAAAEIMANLATKLPAQGGLVQKIFGEKSLAEFGEELILFGPKIAQFAQQVANVDPSSVEGCSLVTSIMTNLANNLPSSDTLWNKIFGGGQVTLSEFGDELVKFGFSMSNFSASVSGMNPEQVNGAIDSFKNLVDLANYIQGTSASDLVNFSSQLSQVGTDGVTKFVQAFIDAGPKATLAIGSLLTGITNVIQNKSPEFQTKGTVSVNAYLTGIKNRYGDGTRTGTELATKVLTALQLKVSDFLTKGTSSGTQYLQGLKNKYGESTSTGQTLANNALAGCQAVISSFTLAGKAAGQGFVDGLKEMTDDARKAGAAIGEAAYDAAKKALDEHSPSKKMEEVGGNAGLGFVNKLMTFVAKAAVAGREIGEATLDGISKSVNSSATLITDDLFDTDPVIRPVVDLSNVVDSVSEINRMFNDAIDYVSGKAQDVASRMSTNRSGTNNGEGNGSKAVNGGNTYNFIQNNNSPKALSRIDIYRQTNNQFSRFKEVTENR